MVNRPAIPNVIKQEVRRRCGFGCVICGALIWEYEHMTPWADDQRHISDNITLLCRYHHGEVTAGRLSKDRVRDANELPYAKQHHFFSSYQCDHSRVREVRVAGQKFDISEDNFFLRVVSYRNEIKFSINFENGVPLFSFDLESAGELFFRVVENEIQYKADGLDDLNFVGKTLKAHDNFGNLAVQMHLDAGILNIDYCEINFGDCVVLFNRYTMKVYSQSIPFTASNNRLVLGPGNKEVSLIRVFCDDRPDCSNVFDYTAPTTQDFDANAALLEARKTVTVKGNPPLFGSPFDDMSASDILALASKRRG